jgi:3-hydroxyacyl-CoA dehydrogenase
LKHFYRRAEIVALNKAVRRIAVVGTGVIGASWSAQYLARGFDVVAADPAPNAEANLRKYVDDAWKVLTSIGLSPGASRDRLIAHCANGSGRIRQEP